MAITQAQSNALSITERAVSVFSIIGILFILFTFYFLKTFHKPINRLIFFASFGNLGMNIACLIAEEGIKHGAKSSLCTFQAFLIQMYGHTLKFSHEFLGVDAFWACCMAINVYLAFFYKYTARQLRTLDKWYLLGCYGASFVPALTLAFIDTRARGPVYGEAILWCWIDIKWDFLRIALLYGIVWIAVLFATYIYIRAGMVIYRRRDQLKGFLNPLNEHPFMTGTVTTSIDIVVEQLPRSYSSPSSSSPTQPTVNYFDKDFDDGNTGELGELNPYTVTITAPPPAPSHKPTTHLRQITREEALLASSNPGAWLYARVAFLFFVSMLIIWIPSSVNRVYALAHPTRINFPLNYVSALVLPAQGILNCIVYVVTSRTAVKQFGRSVMGAEGMAWREGMFFGGGKKKKGRKGLDSMEDAEELVGMPQRVGRGLTDRKSEATLGSGGGDSGVEVRTT
ncbi:MAG: hypothetical protein LQ346_007966 [Caloplaca aetnensis]|nr:MAG: hypothetical protein LQ346_007966 [Caloplaca aetnensis]